MLLGKKEIESIFNSDWSLDFAKITLTSNNDIETNIYSGPGSISQSKDGTLQLKMYYSFESNEEMLFEFKNAFMDSQLPAGKIIAKHHYYALEAIDMAGKIWRADDVWLSGGGQFPSVGKVIKAPLRCITNISDRYEHEDTSKALALVIIPGKYEIPCNEIEKTENSTSLSICALTSTHYECKIKKRDQYLELSTNIPEKCDAESFLNLLMEAISVGG